MKSKSIARPPDSENTIGKRCRARGTADPTTQTTTCGDGIGLPVPTNSFTDPATYTLRTVEKMVKRHPDALTEGGLRHLIFHCGDQMEEAGVLVRFGRRVLLVDPPFFDWLREGNARRIGGKQ